MKIDLTRLTTDSLVMRIPKSATPEEIAILKHIIKPLSTYVNNVGQTCFTLAKMDCGTDHFVSQFEKVQAKRQKVV